MGSAGNTDVQSQIALICALPQAFSWKSTKPEVYSLLILLQFILFLPR